MLQIDFASFDFLCMEIASGLVFGFLANPILGAVIVENSPDAIVSVCLELNAFQIGVVTLADTPQIDSILVNRKAFVPCDGRWRFLVECLFG